MKNNPTMEIYSDETALNPDDIGFHNNVRKILEADMKFNLKTNTKIMVKYDQVDFLKNTSHQKGMYFTIRPHPTTPMLWIQYVLSELNGSNKFAGKLLFNLEDTWLNQQDKAHELYLKNMRTTVEDILNVMALVPPFGIRHLRKTPLIGFKEPLRDLSFKATMSPEDYNKYIYGTFTE